MDTTVDILDAADDERPRAGAGVCMSRGQLRDSAHPERRKSDRKVVRDFSPAVSRRSEGLHYVLVLLLLAAAPVSAQWLGTPDPKVPRTADGKPDLAAPAPKAADGH